MDHISEGDFEKLAKRAGKEIRRVKSITTDSPYIHGVVRSQSGISDWNFSIDFNDYGHLTGNYWINTENSDSSIPKAIANNISSAIKDFSHEYEDDKC